MGRFRAAGLVSRNFNGLRFDGSSPQWGEFPDKGIGQSRNAPYCKHSFKASASKRQNGSTNMPLG